MSTIADMHTVQLKGLDLNLVRVLEVLLRRRSVTLAARELGLSQSATSHALTRLRKVIGDPLFIRDKHAFVATARAEALALPLQQVLRDLELTLRPPDAFEPLTASNKFSIASADYGQLLLLPQLVSAIEATAPGVSLWFTPQSSARVEALLSGEPAAAERVDVVLGPAPAVPHSGALLERALFDERFVCVVRKGHPALGKRWTAERFAALQHAFVAPGGSPGGVVDTALAKLGLTRRVGLAVPNFLAAPFAIAQSDLVATLPERIALLFSRSLPLEIVEPPVLVPGFRLFMYWHERAHHEPAHVWLRAQIANAAAELAPTARAKQARR